MAGAVHCSHLPHFVVLLSAMKRKDAQTTPALSLAERKARLAALVAAGKVTPARAKLIDFREPGAAAIEFGEKLRGKAREVLARDRRAAA